jgi:superfamily II DNA or RNA helicase
MEQGFASMDVELVLTDVLKRKEIYTFFSRSAFEKAVAYQAQGRVRKLEINDDLSHLSATVRGSGSNVYGVDIQLVFSQGQLTDLHGECTCPMADNCKHVAATLLQALSGKPPSASGPADKREAAAAPAAALSYEVTEWLDLIGKVLRGNDYPADQTQRLLYCLHSSQDGERMPNLAVSLVSARVLKGGEFGAQVSQPNIGEFSPERAAKYYRDVDIEILTKLTSRRRAYGYHANERLQSAELLQQIIATGRSFWDDHERPPLRWGEQREGRIEWQGGKKTVVPRLIIPGMTAFNAEPPVYLDEIAGVMGPVELNLPPRLAYQILSAPPLPRAQLAEVATRLGQKIPEIHHGVLPAPPAVAMKITEAPVPILRLKLGRAAAYASWYRDAATVMPVAHLSFRYGPLEVDSTEIRMRLEVFQNGQVYTLSRRRALESSKFERLQALGFVNARSVYSYLEGGHFDNLTFKSARSWLDFLNHGAAELQAEGFEIRIDDDFPYRPAIPAGAFDAEFESSGIDWFELALGVEIDGERRDLAPMLAELLSNPSFTPDMVRKLAEDGDNIYVPLADGRHVALAADRFLPVVLALHSLRLSGVSFEASGTIKLARADVVPLLALESENFIFKSADNLRRLAGLLQGRGLVPAAVPPGFRAELRPYQALGVAWLDLLRESGLGGVLADDMGLGKTVQILALIALEKSRGNLVEPALVVAPTSLMTNWCNEAQKFAPELKVLVLHGANRKQRFDSISGHDLVLTTYPLIAWDKEILLARDWHIAALDEAQTVKNPDAATSRLIRDLKAKHRFCLTGTPMENHLGELWSIMSFANRGYLGDKAAFARHWRSPIEKRADAARAAVLARRVRPFLLRRTKAEVAAELPPKTEILETIVLEGSQRDLYDSIRLSMSAKVRKAIAARGLAKSHIIVLEALLRLRQVCCDPALLKLDDGVERPSAKLDRLMEMVLELLSEGRKIIVFSQFTSMLALIRIRLDAERIRYSLLTGETVDRKTAIETFQGGATDVFLVSLKAGGVGLNLTAADTVIIFDPWWNPAVEQQAIDRAHRIGQDKAVFVYRLVAAGTVEEKMDELKARKRALADSLFDRDGRISSALTEEDVRALFED